MKLNLIILSLFTFSSLIQAQTIITDSTEVFGIWSKDNSPYIIEGEAIVPTGQTLSITPGVTVKFKASNSNSDYFRETLKVGFLNVKGIINAIGTEQDSIIFTRNDTTGYWGIIFLDNSVEDGESDSCIFKYCNIEYGNRIFNINNSSTNDFMGAISIYQINSNLNIENCKIQDNLQFGIYNYSHYKKIIHIYKNQFINNKEGGIYLKYIEQRVPGAYSELAIHEIISNNFYNNANGINADESNIIIIGNTFNNGGIRLRDTGGVVKENSITNSDLGLFMQQASNPLIMNNIISDNNVGIRFDYYCRYSRLINNLIKNCTTGISARWDCSSNLRIINCNIINCNTGVRAYSGSNFNIYNSIFWNNQENVDTDLYINSYVNIKNSLIDSMDFSKKMFDLGGNIINENPLFVSNDNFELSPTSPALNAGSFDTTILANIEYDLNNNKRIVNGRIDLGVYENQDSSCFVYLVSPKENDFYQKGDTLQIDWIKSKDINSLTLNYSFDFGKTWNELTSTTSDSNYFWILPEVDTDSAIIEIYDSSIPELMDVTREFSIVRNLIRDKEEISGTWETDKYTIVGEAIIPEGEQLTIQPGSILEFKTGNNSYYPSETFDLSFLRVNGELKAEGTPSDSIIFTRRGQSGNWGVIAFDKVGIDDKASNNSLKYCKVEFAYAVAKPYGGFDDPLAGAVSLYYSSANIQNCNISKNLIGIFYQVLRNSGQPKPLIRNNYISTNLEGGILCWSNSSPIISGNVLIDNTGYGIRCVDGASPLISNNSILSLDSNKAPNLSKFVSHRINHSITTKILAPDKVSSILTTESEYGIVCEQNANPEIINTLLWGNKSDFKINSSIPALSYSLISDTVLSNGIIDKGNNLLGIDPLIVSEDSINNNIHSTIHYFISMNSPCIDAGRSDTTGLFLATSDLLGNNRFFDGDSNGISNIDIGAIEYNGLITKVSEPSESILPNRFILFQNYPNPFNPVTRIKYTVPKTSHVKIKIFNILGKEICTLVDKNHQSGVYEVNWNGKDKDSQNVSNGLYFCKMASGNFSKTIKLTLLK